MLKEKILSKEEADEIIKKLQMKYGAQMQNVQKLIAKDIQKFGALSTETQIAQKELTDKILSEKENHE